MAGEIQRLVEELPVDVVETLAEGFAELDPAAGARAADRVVLSISNPHYRAWAERVLGAWERAARTWDPGAIASALFSAAACESARRGSQRVELVWSGPDQEAVPIRHTLATLLELVDGARDRILIVSYAVFRIPDLQAALLRAAGRGVTIRIVLEDADTQGSPSTYSPLVSLGKLVAGHAHVYRWPVEKRVRAENGHVGSLHVKCLVADGRQLFISSANLTDYAFTVNMELGVLVTGGQQPADVDRHFQELMVRGVLTEVEER